MSINITFESLSAPRAGGKKPAKKAVEVPKSLQDALKQIRPAPRIVHKQPGRYVLKTKNETIVLLRVAKEVKYMPSMKQKIFALREMESISANPFYGTEDYHEDEMNLSIEAEAMEDVVIDMNSLEMLSAQPKKGTGGQAAGVQMGRKKRAPNMIAPGWHIFKQPANGGRLTRQYLGPRMSARRIFSVITGGDKNANKDPKQTGNKTPAKSPAGKKLGPNSPGVPKTPSNFRRPGANAHKRGSEDLKEEFKFFKMKAKAMNRKLRPEYVEKMENAIKDATAREKGGKKPTAKTPAKAPAKAPRGGNAKLLKDPEVMKKANPLFKQLATRTARLASAKTPAAKDKILKEQKALMDKIKDLGFKYKKPEDVPAPATKAAPAKKETAAKKPSAPKSNSKVETKLADAQKHISKDGKVKAEFSSDTIEDGLFLDYFGLADQEGVVDLQPGKPITIKPFNEVEDVTSKARYNEMVKSIGEYLDRTAKQGVSFRLEDARGPNGNAEISVHGKKKDVLNYLTRYATGEDVDYDSLTDDQKEDVDMYLKDEPAKK